MSRFGTDPTPFAWGGGSGYQTDADGGVRLLGNRYYDSRIGRFLSRDPAGTGDNDYAYCGDDPTDGVDPTGLETTYLVTTWEVTQQWDSKTQTWNDVPGTRHIIDQHTISFPGGQDLMQNILWASAFRHQLDLPPRTTDPLVPYNYLKRNDAENTRGDYTNYKDTRGRPYNDPLGYARRLAGNFNFGAMGAALGYNSSTLIGGANWLNLTDQPLLKSLTSGPMHSIEEQKILTDGFWFGNQVIGKPNRMPLDQGESLNVWVQLTPR